LEEQSGTVSLTPELERIRAEIEGYARDYGLDFFDTLFEIVDWRQMNEIASYGGFPTRYPHWRFGMEHEEMEKGYAYGLHKIYEMVVNNDPAYAYLLQCNNLVDQKLVMAHVFGHVDFFKNNAWFAHTNRKMMDEIANHAARLRQYIGRHGYETVERFIDCCLSLDNLIDYHAPYIKRREEPSRYDFGEEEEEEPTVRKLRSERGYLDPFINPPEFLEEQRQRLEEQKQQKKKLPERPVKDVMEFLLEHAPLDPWQRDTLAIIREEAYYFAPQGMTKVLNEGWACATGDSLVVTEKGLLRFRELVEAGEKLRVSSGPNASVHWVTDWHRETQVPTLRLTTRRGLSLEGTPQHRVRMADGSWANLSDIHIGDRVALACGSNMWPEAQVRLAFQPLPVRPTLKEVAAAAGVPVWMVHRYRRGQRTTADERIAAALAEMDYQPNRAGTAHRARRPLRVPELLDEDLAYVLGVYVGDGHRIKSGITLTCGSEAEAQDLKRRLETLFGVPATVRWCPTTREAQGPTPGAQGAGQGAQGPGPDAQGAGSGRSAPCTLRPGPAERGRWHITVHSLELRRLLSSPSVTLSTPDGWESPPVALAPDKAVPPAILRSPRPVVTAFLRGCFDADGQAGPQGVRLFSSSHELVRTVQILLLNYGIFSTHRFPTRSCRILAITGPSAARFLDEIGFHSAAKRQALEQYVADRRRAKREDDTDVVVSIEPGWADVFDITVETSHAYVANGFINHNSYWHSKIMTEKALQGSELIDYADHHSGTMGPQPGRINPYKLGLELLRDVEDRWNKGRFGKEWEECEDLEAKRQWDRELGQGMAKIFEVRRIHNDVTFIDTFLTPEFCEQHKLFTYRYNEGTGWYEIASREFQQIKEKLLFSLTNFGQPFIYVTDGNFRNRGELYLTHRHEGIDLKLNYARATLENIYTLWQRPVHLETVVEGLGQLLTFDGREHTQRETRSVQMHLPKLEKS